VQLESFPSGILMNFFPFFQVFLLILPSPGIRRSTTRRRMLAYLQIRYRTERLLFSSETLPLKTRTSLMTSLCNSYSITVHNDLQGHRISRRTPVNTAGLRSEIRKWDNPEQDRISNYFVKFYNIASYCIIK